METKLVLVPNHTGIWDAVGSTIVACARLSDSIVGTY